MCGDICVIDNVVLETMPDNDINQLLLQFICFSSSTSWTSFSRLTAAFIPKFCIQPSSYLACWEPNVCWNECRRLLSQKVDCLDVCLVSRSMCCFKINNSPQTSHMTDS